MGPKMKVAITFRHDLSLYQLMQGSDIAQNAKFLYDLLELIDCEPFFLCFGKTQPHTFELFNKKYKQISFEKLIDSKIKVPVVLEVAATLKAGHKAELRKISHSKIVSIKYENALELDAEALCLPDRIPSSTHILESDAVWISPHYLKNKPHLETVYRSQVEVCPYIWEADFISKESLGEVGYDKPDIFVMEPNAEVMQNTLIPLSIVSRLYEERSGSFGKTTILNSQGFKDKKYLLNNIVKNLSGLSKQTDKIHFRGRGTVDDIFIRDDILLGHHWENCLNHLYLEAVHKGVRLVHSSEHLIGVGFYYPSGDIDKGIKSCERAASFSSSEFAEKNERSKQSLGVFSIQNKIVQGQYKMLLQSALNH